MNEKKKILFLAFLNLSKIDTIQQKTADSNKIPLLVEIAEQYPITFDILWALSFNQDIQHQLRMNLTFMSRLLHLAKECENEQIRKMTHGILWNLESIHQGRILCDLNDDNPFDIMISYSHKDETICKQIYEELVNAGYRVWIDFDQMHGNVMDAMAQAIEQSQTILICMSEQYRQSNYCRAEAQYAFQRQVKIIPLLLQNYYQPDGWLSFLIGQLIYVDFTKNDFTRAMEILLKELKAEDTPEMTATPLRSRTGTVAVLCNLQTTTSNSLETSSVNFPKDIRDWTRTNVNDWLLEHDLIQISQLFCNCDGQGLLYLNDFLQHGETRQVINLLQEESLRRTSENLSLIELSNFRALIDREKHRWKSHSTIRRMNTRENKYLRACCQLI